jgi:hypothetical protein
VTLDLDQWLTAKNGRTPGIIVSTAHLDDEERALVLRVLLEELLSWVRGLSGSQRLRALVVFDEVYGFLPPHPANPPTKRPLVALLKQARAFGVGVTVATQNPMDLDYRALSNAGMWAIARLQTDADRARVVEGLGGEDGLSASELGASIKRLSQRWFVLRNVRAQEGTLLFQSRWAAGASSAGRAAARRMNARMRGTCCCRIGRCSGSSLGRCCSWCWGSE